MKKVAIGIVAVLALVLLGLPPLLGLLTESRIRENLASMDDNPLVALNVESYDRDWFSSAARVGVSVDADYARSVMAPDDPNVDGLAAAMLADANVTFVLDIDHGPIVLGNGFYVGLSRFVARLSDDSAVVSEIKTRFAMPYLVEIRGRLGLTGVFDFDADVPPVDYADENGEVYFSGLTSEGVYRDGNLQSSGRIDEISFNSVTAVGRIGNVTFEGDNDRVGPYLWTGPFAFGVESMVLTNPLVGAEPMINVGRLRLGGETRLDDSGELMSGRVVYAADSVVAGPDFSLANAEIAVTFDDFSVDALNAYYDTLLTMDQNDPFAVLGIVQALGSELLAHDPSVALSPIRFDYRGEPFTANIELRTLGANAAGGLDLSNPMMLAALFEITADATASKSLAVELAAMTVQGNLEAALAGEELPPGQDIAQLAQQQAEVMLATFVGQGMIVEAGDNYTTNIEYARGEITVNGTPLPLGMMFQ